VVSADVYAVAPHASCGDCSGYTSSAGWMYQLLVESLLGLQLQGARLRPLPMLPAQWPGFSLTYRFGVTEYPIELRQSSAADCQQQVSLDGVLQTTAEVLLVDDGAAHRVDIECRCQP